MAVEQAKIQLSDAPKAQIMPPTPLLDDLGMAIPIDVEITREQFEGIISPLVERSIYVCKEAIKYSDYPEDMIDLVLLVGGSSQIPLVQQKVKEAFGAERVVVHPSPMYAVAEGAAIVAAGLVEKVGTVSRDYFIKLVEDPRHKIIKQGDILPVKTAHTFKTEADGQSLIHFEFYNRDEVSNRDNLIGDMWLALYKAYPKGTEVLVTAELDEKNGSLQITANLKNDPSVRVSGSFSRGKQDESISDEVEKIIQKLNEENKLTKLGVEEANRLAGKTVDAANQIKDKDGNTRIDRLHAAKENLQKLKNLANDDYHVAEFYISDFEFVLENCDFLLYPSQKELLQTLCRDLKNAINNSNVSEKLIENARRELKNLPEKVQIILACRDGVARAHQVEPNHGRVLAGKLSQMIDALKREDGYEAERLFRELADGIRPYLDRELPTSNNSIATGLTR